MLNKYPQELVDPIMKPSKTIILIQIKDTGTLSLSHIHISRLPPRNSDALAIVLKPGTF
jgi:hypothetical protein